MARPIDETTPTDARTGTVHDDAVRRDDATTRTGTGARTSTARDPEVKRDSGKSKLWIILAVILAVLLALWLFSGAFSSDPELGTAETAPGAANDETIVVPEGSTVDGTPAGTGTGGAVVDAPTTGGAVVDAPTTDGAAVDAPTTTTTVPITEPSATGGAPVVAD